MSQTLTGQLDTTQESARKLQSRRGRSIRKLVGKAPLAIIVTLFLVVVLYPLVWLILSSFKIAGRLHISVRTVESHVSSMLRKLQVEDRRALAAIAARLPAGDPSGPAGPGETAGIMVPLQLVLLPLFTVYFQAGLIDTRWALIITYTAFGLPLSVFLMAGFFKSVPREVMEAAVLDGASIYKVFYRVALPMVANGLVTIALVQFFFLWNDLLFSLTFISSDSNRTIQTGLLNFTGQYGQVDWGPTFAAISLAVIPTLILYLVLNQQVIKGLASGSLKG